MASENDSRPCADADPSFRDEGAPPCLDVGGPQVSAWSATVEEAYRRLGREVWALLYAHCTDRERAHDALQEAFTRLQEQNGTPIRDVRAWLLQVGRNWLRDVARRQRVAARGSDRLDSVAGSQAEPFAVAARDELHEQVRHGLDELREDDRKILVLRYALGWTSQRIAETLEITATAVDMRLSRARRRLAEILEEAGVQHD